VCEVQWDHIISEGAWISVFKRNIVTFLVLYVVLWYFKKYFIDFKKNEGAFRNYYNPLCAASAAASTQFFW
jgi:hypothetical protein